MKDLIKKILKHDITLSALTWVIAQYIRFVFFTSRITLVMDSEAKPYMQSEKNGIFCFWHGRLLMVPCIKPKDRVMHVLVSHHNDGEIITRVVKNLGVDAVRGSSSKGGTAALRNMVDILEAGNNIGITPDGPRGPQHQAAQGAAQLAKIAKKPLVPVSYSVARGRNMRSWDAFLVPFPFTQITYTIGAPIGFDGVGKNAVEQVTEQLQTVMVRDLEQLDDAMGRTC